jgi:hypothetical protein
MDFLFGADTSLPVKFFVAFVIVLALIGGTFWLVRRLGSDRLGSSSSRGRQPRLAVIDAAAVDGRRRLILIRRDNVEHLLMIGGPSDVVVEANIVRAAAPARDAGPARPPAAPDALPRAVPLSEGGMWPLQPTPEPAPTPRIQRQPVQEEPMQWHPEPEPPALPPRRPEPRPEPRIAEPRMTEPRTADPLAGLAAELSRHQQQSEPPAPRPRAPREREPLRARAPQPVPERTPAPQPEENFGPNQDQNLADMAQRLEAALRRPKPSEPRTPEARPPAPAMNAMAPEPAPMQEPHAAQEETPAPTQQQAAPGRAAPAAKPAAQKSVYDSLEQEMASLLGRPNTKT